MPKQTCRCGARYRFDESAIGKRAKCKKCGAVFTIHPETEDGIFALAPLDDDPQGETAAFADRSEAVAEAGQAASAAQPGCTGQPGSSETTPGAGPITVEEAETPKTYGQNIAWAFLFAASLQNAMTFVVLWVVFFVFTLILSGGSLGLGLFAMVRFLGYLTLLGWWAAYRFSVVASGAAGDDDLPGLDTSADGIGDMLMTFLQWIGSWVVVLLPAIVFAIVAFVQGWLDPGDYFDAADGGVVGLLFAGSGHAAGVVGGLVALGLFFWPIIVLCVALGGLECVYRLDLIVTTIVRTLPVYLFTVVLVFGTGGVGYVLAGFVDTRLSAGGGGDLSSSLGLSMLVSFLVTGITMYAEIVAMKLIGLYYHHFKDRFAWSWE